MKRFTLTIPAITATGELPDDPTPPAQTAPPQPLRPVTPDHPRREGWGKVVFSLLGLGFFAFCVIALVVLAKMWSQAPIVVPPHPYYQQVPVAQAVAPAPTVQTTNHVDITVRLNVDGRLSVDPPPTP